MKVPVYTLNLAALARSGSWLGRPRLLPTLFAGTLLFMAHSAVAALAFGRGTATTVGWVQFSSSPDSCTITGALTGPGTITGGLNIPVHRIQYDVINCDVGTMYSWTLYYAPTVGPEIIGASTPNGYVDSGGVRVPQGGVAYTTLFNAGYGVYNYNKGAPWSIDYEPDHITFTGTAVPPGLPMNDGVGYVNPTPYLPSFDIVFNPDLDHGLVPASATVGSGTMNGQVYGPVPGSSNSCLSIQCPNLVFETCSNCIPVTFSATATDTCCSNVILTYNPPSGTCFPRGLTTTVTVTAQDACSNTATSFFTVTVNPGPNCGNTNCISLYASNIVVQTCSNCATVPFNVTAFDPCCSNLVLTYNPPQNTCFPLGLTTPVQVTATDDCGNSLTQTFTVTVNPGANCPPTNCISLYASNIVVQTCSNCTTVPFNVTAFDPCCSNLVLTYNPPQNTCFPLGLTTPVQVTATDDCGNVATANFTVTVNPGPNCGGAKPLSITGPSGPGVGGTNYVTISWSASNAQLMESTDMSNWSPIPGATNSPYVAPKDSPVKFYRLK
jgi:hypothetical protein